MQLTLISDTHGLHENIVLDKGETLIHAGDFTETGTKEEALEFIDWLSEQPFTHKIAIAGNHDFCMEENDRHAVERYFARKDIHYLNDSGTTIDRIKFWGSPITPEFHNWAFNRKRGSDIRQHWSQIPRDIDVLITHGPPYGILDETDEPIGNAGCIDLLNRIQYIQPKFHVFGHIHAGFGEQRVYSTLFINAALLDKNNELTNAPRTVRVLPG